MKTVLLLAVAAMLAGCALLTPQGGSVPTCTLGQATPPCDSASGAGDN